MPRLDDIQVFLQAVDAGSFSEAARQLEITPAFASSAVRRLERSLKTRLFVRSTRTMRLSVDGERFMPHARASLEAFNRGQLAIQQSRGEIAGDLRLSAPSDVGRNILLPWLNTFQEWYPKLSVQLQLTDRPADLLRTPLDAAIRYGLPHDSNLVAQPLAPNNRRALCAAPSYLQKHGTPKSPEDLRKHNCLRYIWGQSVHERWSFYMPEGTQIVAVTGDRISDDADVVRRWAVAGHGLVYKSRIDVLPDILAGRLVEVFPGACGEPAPLNLMTAHRSLLTPAIHLLRSYLQDRITALHL